jgi:exopolysaccharide production protein ExoZ
MLRERFELGRGESNLQPMEGLRGFAVFLVFLVHYVTESGAIGPFFEAVHAIGNTGVDLFFVLSGYLIYGNLIAKPQPFGRFMARRLRRLYPAFIVVFAVYLALSIAMPALSKIPAEGAASYVVANLLMLPGLLPIEPMIAVAWSLSYELFYYLVVPLVILAAGLRGRSPAWRIAFFSALGVGIMAWCFFNAGHVRLAMFVAGILVYELRAKVSDRIAVFAAAIALAAIPLETYGSGPYTLKVAGLFVGFGALCAACFARPHGALGRTFSWTPLRWLGNMSYSYYLIHGLALKAAFMVVGQGHFWPMLPVMFAMALVPSAALFLLVERPFSLSPSGRHAGDLGRGQQLSATGK